MESGGRARAGAQASGKAQATFRARPDAARQGHSRPCPARAGDARGEGIMPPLAWAGAGLAAIVASIFIMLKGGMVERPAKRMPLAEPGGAGGSAGEGFGSAAGEEDP